jgi:hypothetical protein
VGLTRVADGPDFLRFLWNDDGIALAPGEPTHGEHGSFFFCLVGILATVSSDFKKKKACIGVFFGNGAEMGAKYTQIMLLMLRNGVGIGSIFG